MFFHHCKPLSCHGNMRSIPIRCSYKGSRLSLLPALVCHICLDGKQDDFTVTIQPLHVYDLGLVFFSHSYKKESLLMYMTSGGLIKLHITLFLLHCKPSHLHFVYLHKLSDLPIDSY